MQLIVLGSSSRGNCYLLDNGRECLLLECGISFERVKREVGYDISRIVGVLLSHEHGDHSRQAGRCLEARIPLFCSRGTADALKLASGTVHTVSEDCFYRAGGFRFRPFPVKHDAAEPLGFLISHPECGTVLFATDTYYLRHRFRGLNNIMIECNYRAALLEENLQSGRITPMQRRRTIKSHLEYSTCVETLLANDLSGVNHIVLLHLSDGNSDAKAFQEGVRKATGKSVTVADKGVVIRNFDKSPF